MINFSGRHRRRLLGEKPCSQFSSVGVLEAICDADASIRKQMTLNYQNVRILESVSDVINDETISAVVIAAPAVAHYELTHRALEAGKHVFVEKPLHCMKMKVKNSSPWQKTGISY